MGHFLSTVINTLKSLRAVKFDLVQIVQDLDVAAEDLGFEAVALEKLVEILACDALKELLDALFALLIILLTELKQLREVFLAGLVRAKL